jgi:tRNA A37 threonylcarbamoyladenosine dehydratase
MRYPDSQGNICLEKPSTDDGPRQLDCAAGFGSITHLTGTIGFAMAAHALNDYLANQV